MTTYTVTIAGVEYTGTYEYCRKLRKTAILTNTGCSGITERKGN